MRTLHRYILVDFLASFGLALAVTTLMLYLGAIMQGLDYVAKGIPGGVLVRIFTLNIPYILTWSIPVSAMVSTLLLFGRLSMDGEFTAMRSGGLSTWQIISPVILASMGLSFVCLVIHYEIAPESRFARRRALVMINELDPVELLDEGRFVRFPTLEIYITRKTGNRLQDVEVYELDANGAVVQTIRAQRGEITTDTELQKMQVSLEQVQIQHPDPENPTDLTRARVIDMDSYVFPVDYAELMRNQNITRNLKDMRAFELMATIRDTERFFPGLPPERREAQRMRAIIEAHKRLALSMACISFTLVGIPLGIKSHRHETSVGIPLGLGVVILFYVFIVTADSLTAHPELLPDYIGWIPVFLCQTLGVLRIRKIP